MKPTLAPEAFHGPPGEFVRTVESCSEADPAAVLATFLTTFGCYVGPSPRIEAGRGHTARLHTLMIGRSAKARKGSSKFPVVQVFEAINRDWTEQQIIGGLGSGEAIITAADGGDRKVLVTEEEFGKILAVAARQGSTIAQLLRQSWDSGHLEQRLAGSSQVVGGAHLALLAHVTIGEFLEKLAAADAVWQDTRATAAEIFPSRMLSDDETKLLHALVEAGDAGRTADQRRDVFHRHRTADQLDRMVATLEGFGYVTTATVPTGGRPASLVMVTQRGADSAESADTSPSPLPGLAELLLSCADSGAATHERGAA